MSLYTQSTESEINKNKNKKNQRNKQTKKKTHTRRALLYLRKIFVLVTLLAR